VSTSDAEEMEKEADQGRIAIDEGNAAQGNRLLA